METPPEQNSSSQRPVGPAAKAPAKFGTLPHGCGLYLFGGFVLLVLIGFLMPVGGYVRTMSPQTKSLAQAKQIGLALRLFAGDHDGNYPRQGVPLEIKEAPRNSNQAFAAVFPTYCQSERIFGNKQSAYQTRVPDNVIDNPSVFPPVRTLEPGENVYGYVMGLTEGSPPGSPLVVEGTDGSGHYHKEPRLRGGLWSGQKAVVIYLDNSGALENLHGPDSARYLSRGSWDKHNLLDPEFLGKDVRYLDPAVPGP